MKKMRGVAGARERQRQKNKRSFSQAPFPFPVFAFAFFRAIFRTSHMQPRATTDYGTSEGPGVMLEADGKGHWDGGRGPGRDRE